MDSNLYDLFAARFPADRTRPFIETDGGKILSYLDLEATSGRYARLLGKFGVTRGERLAIQVDKSPEALFLYLAALRAGAIVLPLNTAYTARELGYFLADAEPRLVVCAPEREAEVAVVARQAGTAKLLTLDGAGQGSLAAESAGLDADAGVAAVAPDDIATILYTSGTTGLSKGAMLSHGNLASNALTLHEIWGFRPDDVLLHALPIFHVHGLFVATNCVLLNGSGMLFLPRFEAGRVVALLPRASVMMGVPTHYTRLLAEPGFGPEACRNMRLFISGSAPLLEETFHAFEARSGHRILERYGMTECSMNTSNPLDGPRVPGTVGPPLPGVEVRVVDEDGRPRVTGETGALEVKGPNVFTGYWRKPEKTTAAFRDDGFFITGDLASIDPAGYLRIVGRSKDLIICGGLNVYPKEIELLLDEMPGVAESAVFGLPHPDFGEAVAAVVVASADAEVADLTDRVKAAAKDCLANFKAPKRVFLVHELPRNTMGKVQKNQLRETYKEIFSAG